MKGTAYTPTEYLFSSTRLRAREGKLVGRARLLQLAAMKDVGEVISALIGEGMLDEQARTDFHGALDGMLQRELAVVRASLPQPRVVDFLLYPTDCHNIKVALKCHYRRMDPTPLFEENGSVPTALLRELSHALPEEIPAHMRAAIGEAREAYEQNADARALSMAIDRACFADMAEAAAPVEMAREMVAARADVCNLFTVRRLLTTQRSAAGEVLLAAALVPGGRLADNSLCEAYRGGEEAFAAFVATTPYHKVMDTDDLSVAERRAEDLVMQRADLAKAVPFGIEVAIAYVHGLLVSVKNLRILYTAKKSGAPEDVLLGRLRESYV